MKILLTCACISLDTNSVIPVILSDLQHATTICFYVLSGTGTLMADNAKGDTQTYSVKSGQGFMIFPGQINTYIADEQLPWEYMWIEFDGLRVKEALSVTDLCKDAPVYHSAGILLPSDRASVSVFGLSAAVGKISNADLQWAHE